MENDREERLWKRLREFEKKIDENRPSDWPHRWHPREMPFKFRIFLYFFDTYMGIINVANLKGTK